ncbi:MAG: heavy metal translocating P-type ATPase [Burkholderiaceae bacterium]
MSGTSTSLRCFHCGLPVDQPGRWHVRVDHEERPMCCAGCQAVAEAILAAGLDDYYRHRATPVAGAASVPPELEQLSLYDAPEIQAGIVRERHDESGTLCEVSLAVEGMRCGACVWLLERALAAEPGVSEASVNFATERATVRWSPALTQLSTLLERFQGLGYRARPFDVRRREAAIRATSRDYIRRLFIAGIGMMQVMMYALPGYTSEPGEIDEPLVRLMRWASLVLTLPVVLYSARPFFAGAWRDLRARSPGMDVPVALGIGAAFVASLHASLTGRGEVYFDSVTMFVFLLLGARYLEWIARRRAGRALDEIAGAAPEQATRLLDPTPGDPATGSQDAAEARTETVPAARLAIGDRIRVAPGERVAVDARLRVERASIDQSLLTGEPIPVLMRAGDMVPGGAVNAGDPIELEVVRQAADSTLSTIERLIERGASEKPRIERVADRVATVFVTALLALAALVYAGWSIVDPERAFPVAIAVLVVSCPCALSLATPAAIAAATGSLLRRRILMSRGQTLETLATCTDVVFDKTGTLTRGEPELAIVQVADDADRAVVLTLAAALEESSSHPFARALRRAAPPSGTVPRLAQRRDQAGFGVAAEVLVAGGQSRRVALGTATWCALSEAEASAWRQRPATTADGESIAPGKLADTSEAFLVQDDVSDQPHVLARFGFVDPIVDAAPDLVQTLKAADLHLHLLSGDRAVSANAVAASLGIETVSSGADPAAKLAYVEALQAEGRRVLMVGDGINDAPVLARADASIAVGRATALARTAADVIVLGPDIRAIASLIDTSRRALRIVRQNLGWAVAYNTVAIPAAALGLVPPWAAAIGMAVSSLAVALNALRLWSWKRFSS